MEGGVIELFLLFFIRYINQKMMAIIEKRRDSRDIAQVLVNVEIKIDKAKQI